MVMKPTIGIRAMLVLYINLINDYMIGFVWFWVDAFAY